MKMGKFHGIWVSAKLAVNLIFKKGNLNRWLAEQCNSNNRSVAFQQRAGFWWIEQICTAVQESKLVISKLLKAS